MTKKFIKLNLDEFHKDTSGSIDPNMIKEFLLDLSLVVQADKAKKEALEIGTVTPAAPACLKKRM